ncbi:alpha/beta fold hydrolase [Anaeromyxobacter terrae]|uniref:alpha/beta fold hydrolase n=1 Tax=Anaeromyxobacter terrae TaxID=2925406 RepID=UPI001F57A4BA|nr:alpha/beta hydrolase [Anaeromyxobacter sp. SG22]
MTPLETVELEANGLRFFALAAGPADGLLVLLLHGFPELSRSWLHQLPALAAAGYRAVAPDLRGYGRTERRGPYDLRTLAGDVAWLVRALGRERAIVCGHDWGGAMAWAAATYAPRVVERLVVLNCPHPATLARELLVNPRQLLRSRYMLAFQLPWLPERLLARDHAAAIARALRGGAYRRDAFPRDELEPYREAFASPDAAAAALGYYRAAFRGGGSFGRDARTRPVAAPTLVVWGVRDRFLGLETIAPEKMAPWFAPGNAPAVVLVPEAGHFVQNEAPDEVNRAILTWLAETARR